MNVKIDATKKISDDFCIKNITERHSGLNNKNILEQIMCVRVRGWLKSTFW